jgi:oxepin-CoA hydrolase / 3-oxo-5,6-dehydrosuberyl-CoA semialdehyde dehydrogenase
MGRHICVPLEGVAIHINAFNFPCWGMLEKMAPALLAGVPCIVKPATATSYLTEAMFRVMVDAKIFPEGAIQLICGSAGDLLDHVMEQDVVAFTGSAATGHMLKEGKAVMALRPLQHGSGLAQLLHPWPRRGARYGGVRPLHQGSRARDDHQGRTEVHGHPPHDRPAGMEEDVIKALGARLDKTVIGDPGVEGVRMGPLASGAGARRGRQRRAHPRVRRAGVRARRLRGGRRRS